MGYLNGTTGCIGGVLPAPHDAVRIEIGPAEGNRICVTYDGNLKITRTVATLRTAMDLPGVSGSALQAAPLERRKRHLRPV